MKQLSQSQVEDYYVPIVKRLTAGEWFTSRASACGLIAPAYPQCGPIVQEELRKYPLQLIYRIFAQLVKDDTPMIRRSAGNHLHKLVGVLQKSQVISEFVPLLKVLVDDDQVMFFANRNRIQ